MTKNTLKNARRTIASTRPSQRAGAGPTAAARRLIALKEASSEDEERSEAHRDDEQEDRNRRRPVEVRLRAEREDVRELVERIVLRHNAPARQAQDLGLDEQLTSDGERD